MSTDKKLRPATILHNVFPKCAKNVMCGMKTKCDNTDDTQKFTSKIDLLALAFLWIMSIVIVNPFGDFPLNDDWAYGLTVKHFLDTGDFRPGGWTSMPLITHVLWGGLFCIPFDFSFEALRFSSLSISLLGVLGSYLLIIEVIYMVPLFILGFFDRYIITVLPFLAGCVVTMQAKNQAEYAITAEMFFPVTALLITGLFFVFAICGVHDYLTWNRARWVVINELMEQTQAKADDIDGGFEFNGLNLYDPDYRRKKGKSWWWVNRDSFVVAFGVIPGYSIIRECKYYQWMPPNEGSIVLLMKNH